MREIIADSNSPTYNIAKWLINECQNLGTTNSKYSVANSHELIEKLRRIERMGDDEVMVSFDVKALFPNTPVKESIFELERWLSQFGSGPEWRRKVRINSNLARLCMNENYFTFRDRFYKTTSGVPMKNPLSPLFTGRFMSSIEEEIESRRIMPKVWCRYVERGLGRDNIDMVISSINKIDHKIEFTLEVEKDGALPFLDLNIVNSSGKLRFEIYRTIPATSHPTFSEKLAAYNCMIHRLITYPLSEYGFNQERQYIIDTAIKNGYNPQTIEKLIVRKIKQHNRHAYTTLFSQQKEATTRRISIPYSYLFNNIRNWIKKFQLEAVGSSRSSTLRNLLGSVKDPLAAEEKSKICRTTCNDCNKVYIGQTKRLITTRFNEHIKEAVNSPYHSTRKS